MSKPHKTKGGHRVYLNLIWNEGGRRYTFRICEATKRTREANLQLGWDTVYHHNLATPEGRTSYRSTRPKGQRRSIKRESME